MDKLLFISSRPLYPIIGGDQIRTVQQLNYLKERFIVEVAFITSNKNENENLDNYPCDVKVKYFYLPRWKSILQTLWGIFSNKPLQVCYYQCRKLKKYIKKHATDFDAVFCNNIRTGEYKKYIDVEKSYLDYVDAISMNYEKAKNNAKGLKKMIYWVDFKRCRRYEKKMLEKFEACAVISNVDQQYILS